MAEGGEEETEYESDPEEAKMSLKMRRREASDDEDVEERRDRDVIVDSEVESDGQGAPAEYDEEYDHEDEGEYYDEQEEVIESEDEYEEKRETGIVGGKAEDMKAMEELTESSEAISEGKGEEGAKKNEPFAVPTSGAFYMHDDRFQDNAGARHRRTFDGRKLWESKDDRKWGHDKFEELNIQERRYEQGRRSSRGFYRGHGKTRAAERGYSRGSRTRGYGGNDNQNVVKDVKGRGPTRYRPSMKNKSEILPPQNRQSARPLDKTSHTGSGKTALTNIQNAEHESSLGKKVASNLSSASPPFYPSGSSNKDVTMTQKKESQAGNHNRNIRPSGVNNSYPMQHSNSFLRAKNVTNSVGMDKLHIDGSVSPAGVRTLNNVHLSSVSSSLVGTQIPQSRAEAKGISSSACAIFHPPQENNQFNKNPIPVTQALPRNPVPIQIQPCLQPSSVQQLGQHSPGGSRGSSPPKTGKGSVQGAGRGSIVYSGTQIVGSGGNLVSGHSDQNLPAFFPVMQFGGQHPGGIGVPAVGMAFPGYVAQPNGLGNSEMTWLPVLASAAGALGTTYCPPYIAVDGSYTGQTSALPAPSKENNSSKASNELKPQQRPEVANHDFSQRQNKPRRYSEMNFSQ